MSYRCRSSLIRQPVERADDAAAATIQDMGVHHRGADVGVPEQLLDRADVMTRFEQMRRERVPQRMRRGGLRNAGAPQGLAHRPLERLVADVVPPLDAASWVERAAIGGKNILPAPIARSVRVFSFERRRQPDSAESGTKITRMKFLGLAQLHAEGVYQALGKYRDPVLRALSVANEDCAAREVDVLDSQTSGLHDAQPRAIEKFPEQAMRSVERGEQSCNFLPRKHNGQAYRHLRVPDAIEQRQFARQHLAIEEQQRALSLVLRRSGYLQIDGKVGQKRFNVCTRQIRRMAIAMKANEAFDPVDICLLGAQAVVLEADSVADLVEQPWPGGVLRHGLGSTITNVFVDCEARDA